MVLVSILIEISVFLHRASAAFESLNVDADREVVIVVVVVVVFVSCACILSSIVWCVA